MDTLALIPARGGSRGIPQKNLAPLAGKPLLAHTITAAREAKSVTRIVVSTDEATIASVAREWGAEVLDRPAELATDTAPTEPVIEHVLSTLAAADYQPDLIVLLQPTSPLRDAAVIDACVEKLLAENLDSLFTACEDHGLYWRMTNNGPQAQYDIFQRPRRQDLPPAFKENGAVYVTRFSCWEQYGNRLGGRIGMYVMPASLSLDIDGLDDLRLAEAILTTKG